MSSQQQFQLEQQSGEARVSQVQQTATQRQVPVPGHVSIPPVAHASMTPGPSVSRPGKIRRLDRTQHARWTAEEEGALRAGLAKHGFGKWQAIICDPDPAIGPLLLSRTNVDLKDKWRNLRPKDKDAGDGKRRRPSGPPVNAFQTEISVPSKTESRLGERDEEGRQPHAACAAADESEVAALWARGATTTSAGQNPAVIPAIEPSREGREGTSPLGSSWPLQRNSNRSSPPLEGPKRRVISSEAAPSGKGLPSLEGQSLEQQQHFQMIRHKEQEVKLLQQARAHYQQQQTFSSKARYESGSHQPPWSAASGAGYGGGYGIPSIQQQQAWGNPPPLLSQQQQQQAAFPLPALRSTQAQQPSQLAHPHPRQDRQQQQQAMGKQQQQMLGRPSYHEHQGYPVSMHPQVASAFAAGHELAMLQQARGQQQQQQNSLQHRQQEIGSASAGAALQSGLPLPAPTPHVPGLSPPSNAPGYGTFPVASVPSPRSTSDSFGTGVGNRLGVTGHHPRLESLLALQASSDAWAAFGLPFSDTFGASPAGPLPAISAALASYAATYGLDPKLGAALSPATCHAATSAFGYSRLGQPEIPHSVEPNMVEPGGNISWTPTPLAEGLQLAAASALGATGGALNGVNGPGASYASALAAVVEVVASAGGRYAKHSRSGSGSGSGMMGGNGLGGNLGRSIPPAPPVFSGASQPNSQPPPIEAPHPTGGRLSRNGNGVPADSTAFTANDPPRNSNITMTADLTAGDSGEGHEAKNGNRLGASHNPNMNFVGAVWHPRSNASKGMFLGEEMAANIIRRSQEAGAASEYQTSLQGGSRRDRQPRVESQQASAVGGLGAFTPFRQNSPLGGSILVSSGSGQSFGNARGTYVRPLRSLRRGSLGSSDLGECHATGTHTSKAKDEAVTGREGGTPQKRQPQHQHRHSPSHRSLSCAPLAARAGFLLDNVDVGANASSAAQEASEARAIPISKEDLPPPLKPTPPTAKAKGLGDQSDVTTPSGAAPSAAAALPQLENAAGVAPGGASEEPCTPLDAHPALP